MSWQQRSEESSGPRQKWMLLMLIGLDAVIVGKMVMPQTFDQWRSEDGNVLIKFNDLHIPSLIRQNCRE